MFFNPQRLTVINFIRTIVLFYLGIYLLGNLPSCSKREDTPQEITQEPTQETRQVNVDELIGELAVQIYSWKRNYSNGIWWNCGKKLNNTEQMNLATDIAKSSISSVLEYSTKEFPINYEDLISTLAVESGFDSCAINKQAKDFAKRNKIWKRSNKPSYTEKEINELYNYIKDNSVDITVRIGLSQISWPNQYNGSFNELLDIQFNTDVAVEYMKGWVKTYGTTRPALYWKGEEQVSQREKVLSKFGYQIFGER